MSVKPNFKKGKIKNGKRRREKEDRRQETGGGRTETGKTGGGRIKNGDRRPETGEQTMGEKVGRFEDLEVWKEGMRLATEIYQALNTCRDYGLRDQMQRAAVSIPSNIAEGYERNTNKDFIHFLYIAKGSCSELRTQIYLAVETGVFDKTTGNELLESTKKISAMLYNFIKVRKERF